jgi:DNA-binding CsgD family transcriptional regulator
MQTLTSRRFAERLSDRIARANTQHGGTIDLPTLAELVYDELSSHVSYDFACFATTDPASGVVTWASKTKSLGVGDEEFAASEYGPPDVNKFEDLAQRRTPVGVLSIDTDGHPETCRRHREFMQPRFGFTDELRAVFRSRSTSWGAIGVYKGPGDPPFTMTDAAQLAEACDAIAVAIQRSLFRTETPLPADTDSLGPAVLIVDPRDKAVQQTPAARAAVEELGGLDHGSLPENLLAVVVTCRTTGAPFTSQVKARSGRWMSLRASPLDGATPGDDVVVTIEPTPPAALSRLALAAHGLTAREEDVALLVLQGVDTRGIAATLHLSPHTVQDHLKKVFAKVGVTSRRELTARLVLA